MIASVREGRVAVVEPDGEHGGGGGAELQARVAVHSPAVYTAMLARGKGMARPCAEGLWD